MISVVDGFEYERIKVMVLTLGGMELEVEF